jgi:hypothetical protein
LRAFLLVSIDLSIVVMLVLFICTRLTNHGTGSQYMAGEKQQGRKNVRGSQGLILPLS